MTLPAIVIPAFNRADALLNLLDSISKAHYPIKVKLIISLEFAANKDVVEVANTFNNAKFDIEIIRSKIKLGLRNHIIKCGDLSLKYGSVIVLEDDLYVDPFFYSYAVSAVNFYSNDISVAGIALYSNEHNEFFNLPFRPMRNGYDAYHMQVPCSWGQCWTSEQWIHFKDWYQNATELSVRDCLSLPNTVKEWPSSSWKKFYAAYLITNNKFFVYPYVSLTTNCSQVGGEHIQYGTDVHQVHLSSRYRHEQTLSFPVSLNPDVVYDAYMEPVGAFIFKALKIDAFDLEVDLMGQKPALLIKKKKYCLTTKKTESYIQFFPRVFRPVEQNLIVKNYPKGKNSIYLVESTQILESNNQQLSIADYSYYANMDLLSKKILFKLFKELLIKKINNLIN